MPKHYLKFYQPQILPPIQYLDFKKTLKCIEMTPCQFKEYPGIGLYIPFSCTLYGTLTLAWTYICTLAELPTMRK